MKLRQKLGRIRRLIHKSFRNYYVFYADSTELLNKAQKVLRPLPEGCELVKLTKVNKDHYKCKRDVNQMLAVEGEVWVVVDNDNEIIGYHYGTYCGKKSLFFKIKNCDYEHIEIWVDERYRRKGIGVYLLYHTVQNLDSEYIKNNKIATCIKPDNIPSIKMHELIGFKKSHRVILFYKMKKKDGQFKFLSFPRYTI